MARSGGETTAMRDVPVTWILLFLGPTIVFAAVTAVAYMDIRNQLGEVRVELATLKASKGDLTPPGVELGGDQSPQGPPPAPVTQCTGVIAPALVQTVVGTKGPDVFDCYRRRQAAQPSLAGLLILLLRVNVDGSVDEVTMQGALTDEELQRCVTGRVGQWRFPPPVGAACAVVRLPFDLRPE